MALWVEERHGADGPSFIDKQIKRLARDGEAGGVAMWCRVGQMLKALSTRAHEHLC